MGQVLQSVLKLYGNRKAILLESRYQYIPNRARKVGHLSHDGAEIGALEVLVIYAREEYTTLLGIIPLFSPLAEGGQPHDTPNSTFRV